MVESCVKPTVLNNHKNATCFLSVGLKTCSLSRIDNDEMDVLCEYE